MRAFAVLKQIAFPSENVPLVGALELLVKVAKPSNAH